ncbi:pilus assembly protein [Acidimicrobiia bacterium EGI L10123]|uniref:TadE/TadG family type IV pilus assembly protein n=1 Tax=Salinilacustrithrix flava TaxID=2957203 RepID=UPI003D7C309A|nr:pilus assembly protein [Acidimicrobiia bacterium EGI L10123]
MSELRARGRDRERGASLVEFALVVPLLSLFLFGIVQFGIAYDKQQSINSGAREGARLAALDSSTLADISTRSVQASDASATGNDPKVVVSDSSGAVAGVRCPGGAYSKTDTCASPAAVNEAEADLMPCGRAAPSAYATVIVSTPYDITIPFWGVQPVTIDSEAQFRCE